MTKQDEEELHLWAQSIRKNYRPLHKEILEDVVVAKKENDNYKPILPLPPPPFIDMHVVIADLFLRCSSSSRRLRKVTSKKLLPLTKRQQASTIARHWIRLRCARSLMGSQIPRIGTICRQTWTCFCLPACPSSIGSLGSQSTTVYDVTS